ncbi:MAG: hypothetical protein M3R02_13965 [Chloroflexota bacterium]|nr:hypothetical protein [Chloroflexota bacterium]
MEDDRARHPEEEDNHTGDGSEPEPTPWMPDGWIYMGDGFARPDPDHPTYPAEHFRRREALDFARLADDPGINQTLADLQARLSIDQAAAYFLAEPDLPSDAARALYARFATAIRQYALAATERPHPLGIPRRTCANYLMNRLLVRLALRLDQLDRVDAARGSPGEPVDLLYNPSSETTQVGLEPGQFILRFTHASPADRSAYDDLIEATQDTLGYAALRDAGGRARNERVALAVARLRLLEPSLTYRRIGARVGLANPGTERIRQLNKEGIAGWKQRYGPSWEERLVGKNA